LLRYNGFLKTHCVVLSEEAGGIQTHSAFLELLFLALLHQALENVVVDLNWQCPVILYLLGLLNLFDEIFVSHAVLDVLSIFPGDFLKQVLGWIGPFIRPFIFFWRLKLCHLLLLLLLEAQLPFS
jgi:hypothetical protein